MLKAQVLEAIQKMPENASMDDMMYRLYIIDKIEKGKSALLENKTMTTEQLQNQISQW